MQTDTQTVTVAASPEDVFTFLADPETLPQWAVGFCRGIRRNGEGWVVDTGHGEVGIRYVTDADRGLIDFHMTPAPGVEVVAYSRVIPTAGGAEYVFTQVRAPGMSDEAFAGQRAALTDELEVLRARFRARAACDSGR